MFVADDENGACSLPPAQDLSCVRILPEINDVLPPKEPCDSLPNDSSSVLHDVCAGSGVSCSQVCHKQDLDCHTYVDTAAVSPSADTLLPSLCGTDWTDVDNVTVADVHLTDSSPREKLLPSLCDTNPTGDNCDNPADADSSQREKLLPLLCDTNPTGDNPADADSSQREKLLPSLCDTNPTADSCDNIADADSRPLEKLLPFLSDEN